MARQFFPQTLSPDQVALFFASGEFVPAENTAVFNLATGLLTIVGDDQDNVIVVSRNAAGVILVNGDAFPITGGVPTVANTGPAKKGGTHNMSRSLLMAAPVQLYQSAMPRQMQVEFQDAIYHVICRGDRLQAPMPACIPGRPAPQATPQPPAGRPRARLEHAAPAESLIFAIRSSNRKRGC
jgi:hypothetical protein